MTKQLLPELTDYDAEHSLLGSALFDPSIFLAFNVTPDDFSDAKWRALWRAGQENAKQEIKTDQVTLADDVLQVIGGAATLVSLQNACPSSTRAGSYALLVKQGAERRRLVEIADKLARAAHQEDAEARHNLVRLALENGAGLLSETGTGAAPWKLYTLADAYAERAPVSYAVEGLFSLGSLSVAYGAPGCLKSMLLADLAVCVATGTPWLPPLPDGGDAVARKTIPLPVLWVDFDNGTQRTHERFEALGKARGADPGAVALYYASMPTPWLDGSDAVSVDSLIAQSNVLLAGLIIVDNLGSVSGNADENSIDMVRVLGNFRRLAEETGAAVVLIHHQRKSNSFKSRAGESLRGHSSIESALDLALLVEREEHSDKVTVKSTKTRGLDVLPFGATFAYDHKENTTELAAAQFYGLRIETKTSQTDGAILDIASETAGINQTALRQAAREALPDNITASFIRSRVKELADRGKLLTQKGVNNATLYSLPA